MAVKPRLSIVESKAIGWYSKHYNLTPQLSAWPNYRFKSKENGEWSEKHINAITIEYKAVKAEEAKEKARAKKQEMQAMQRGNAGLPNNSKPLR